MDVDRTAADGREPGPLHRSCVDRRTQIRAREARPGRRGGGSCSRVITKGSLLPLRSVVTLWWLDHPLASWQLPLLDEQDLRGRGRRLGKFDLDYVTLRNYA